MSTNGVYGNGRTIVVATQADGVYLSTDYGATWDNYNTFYSQLFSNQVNGVFSYGPSIYAATTAGLAYSNDAGYSWSQVDVNTGLADNWVTGVWSGGFTQNSFINSPVYASTTSGLSYSPDGGQSWVTYNFQHGLHSDYVSGVFATATTVYAATWNGVAYGAIGAPLGPNSFTNVTTGLGSVIVRGVYAVGSTVYAATAGGLSISTNGGLSYTNYTQGQNGLGSNDVNAVWASGSTIYAATTGGLSISTNGGTSFINYNGLPGTTTSGVWGDPSNVYVTGATNGGLSMGV